MKLLTDDLQTTSVGNFAFSAVRPEKLGAAEYTLVTLVTDKTGSVSGFEQELVALKRAVVEACAKSPRAGNLMLRDVEFNSQVDEVTGFADLANIDASVWQAPRCYGSTALFDATYNAVAATNAYGRILADQDFLVNGIIFVITDGDDNVSTQTARSVAAEKMRGVQDESLESLMVVLIGVNAQRYSAELTAFKNDGQLDQYVDAGDATPENLAKLASFVAKSISSQSQSLGTGGPSQPLVF